MGRVLRASDSVGFLILLSLMGLLLFPNLPNVSASSVIALDASASTSCGSGGNPCASTLSWSHTVGSQSNMVLIVGVVFGGTCGSIDSSTVCPTITSVTYGGNTLTLIDSSADGITSMFDLVSPPTSVHTVTVTFDLCSICTTPPSISFAVGGSSSYFNAASVGVHSHSTGSGSPASVTVNANSGDLVVDTFGSLDDPTPAWSAGGGQTQRWNQANSGGEVSATFTGAGSDKSAASPVTMTWSSTGASSSFVWDQVGVQLVPSAPAIPEYPLGLPLLALFMVIGYGLIKRRTRNQKNI